MSLMLRNGIEIRRVTRRAVANGRHELSNRKFSVSGRYR